MYCFAGFAKKSSGIVVDYLPLASSTVSFRTSNDAFRYATTKTCLNLGVEELLGGVGDLADLSLVVSDLRSVFAPNVQLG